jgi:hypothetical protein
MPLVPLSSERRDALEDASVLKGMLINFALTEPFQEPLGQLLRAGGAATGGQAGAIQAIEAFLFEHRYGDGSTVLDRFLRDQPGLSSYHRGLVEAWKGSVRAVFEVIESLEDQLLMTDVLDGRTYSAHASEAEAVAQLPPGTFLQTRILPVDGIWALSGTQEVLTAAEIATATGHLARTSSEEKAPMPLERGRAAPAPSPPRLPTAIRPHADQIIAVTDAVCVEHLDAEYAELCRRVVGRLSRKRPSPIVRGDLRIWAAGVVYAVGQLNFIFDPAQTPHATADQLSTWLGVKKTTMANKAVMVRDVLKLDHFDSELMRRELVHRSPFTWLLEVDGMPVDARNLPPHLQLQALELGLIPYLPTGRPGVP